MVKHGFQHSFTFAAMSISLQIKTTQNKFTVKQNPQRHRFVTLVTLSHPAVVAGGGGGLLLRVPCHYYLPVGEYFIAPFLHTTPTSSPFHDIHRKLFASKLQYENK